jgi:hypothetical protein
MYVQLTEKGGIVSLDLTHVRRPNYVLPGNQLTKSKRQEILNVVSVAGIDSMKAENLQRKIIEDGTGVKCLKSGGMRINEETLEFTINNSPYSSPDASFEWTEDFDGFQVFGQTFPRTTLIGTMKRTELVEELFDRGCDTGGTIVGLRERLRIARENDSKCRVFYNFKSIAESGGSQTRSLKAVYIFVKAQQKLIHSGNVDKNTLFANILDGHECSNKMELFRRFDNERQIYVGDLFGYFEWLNSKLDTIL